MSYQTNSLRDQPLLTIGWQLTMATTVTFCSCFHLCTNIHFSVMDHQSVVWFYSHSLSSARCWHWQSTSNDPTIHKVICAYPWICLCSNLWWWYPPSCVCIDFSKLNLVWFHMRSKPTLACSVWTLAWFSQASCLPNCERPGYLPIPKS